MGLQPFVKESWVEFTIGTFIVFLRIYARTRKIGFRGWQGDDYLILLSLALYATEAALWHLIGHGTAIRITPSSPASDLAIVRRTSKYNFIVWIAYTSFIWSLKGCLLFFYSRLTMTTKVRKFVIMAAWVTGLSYIAGILELFLHCRPFHRTWAILPYQGTHCASGHDNFIAIGSMNFFTDLVILAIPLPLLWKVRLPWQRKLIVCLLLLSGVFVLLATALRNILGFMSIKGTAGILNKNFVLGWAVRENFVALIVVNAPCIKPLFSSHHWLKSSSRGPPSTSDSNTPRRRPQLRSTDSDDLIMDIERKADRDYTVHTIPTRPSPPHSSSSSKDLEHGYHHFNEKRDTSVIGWEGMGSALEIHMETVFHSGYKKHGGSVGDVVNPGDMDADGRSSQINQGGVRPDVVTSIIAGRAL